MRDLVGVVDHNDGVTVSVLHSTGDTAEVRKARGAFFTPPEITRHLVRWAVRSPDDRVLEPAAGEAAFLIEAVKRLSDLGAGPAPEVDGVEIHAGSAARARRLVKAAGGAARIKVKDFFTVTPRPAYSSVIGNPPYIRYQEFRGVPRSQSRAAASRAGVELSGLASSWAAFTVHAALFLRPGGRMALVLPAELLSVNYAAPVRQFLFTRFRTVELVMFDEQVFPGAEADVVLLLADGFGEGPSAHVTIRRSRNAHSLSTDVPGQHWVPGDPAQKWVYGLVDADPVHSLQALLSQDRFSTLDHWGDTTLGMVTGNNGYFALSNQRVRELGLRPTDVLRLSPPGSSHLRGLALSADMLARLEHQGKAVYLFRPAAELSPAADRYVKAGRAAGVHTAYKCRVRRPWYLVPLVKPADLLLTCMNADTPRLVTNSARAHHLNSVHGVYLGEGVRDIGRELLPVAALNSVTLLHAEIVGRSYGGGILKIEPREADRWAVPALRLVTERAGPLRDVRRRVAATLRSGNLMDAVDLVDRALGLEAQVGSASSLNSVRTARDSLALRRSTRSRSGH